MTTMIMVQALNNALGLEMNRDKDVLVMGEDVGKNGGVFRVTDGLWKKFGDERVIDTPLSESGIVGTAIGLAAYGFKPVAEVQFSGFLYPAFDQLISHAARLRNRSRGLFGCQLVVRTPYSGGVRALEHHSESMEAIYAHTPGLKVVIPSTPYDAKGLLLSSIRDPDPVVFLEPKRLYRSIKEDVPEDDFEVPLGKAHVVQEGDDVTIIAWGAMMKVARDAATQLKGKYSVEVIDTRTLKPLDDETILGSVKKTGRCVVVHEAPRTGGFGAEIIARINEKALLSLEAPVERVTGFDIVVPLPKMEQYYLPNAHRAVKAIEKVMSY